MDPTVVPLAALAALGAVVTALVGLIRILLKMLAAANITNAQLAATQDKTLTAIEQRPDKAWFLERQAAK